LEGNQALVADNRRCNRIAKLGTVASRTGQLNLEGWESRVYLKEKQKAAFEHGRLQHQPVFPAKQLLSRH
jgi:hypothetical protein